MNFPLVTVIIPTYNYAIYIEDSINSVLSQNYPSTSIEIIVVDDGSTDNTSQILQPYVNKGLLSYYYQQNKGKANATYQAIQKSSGKYIFNLDADDLLLPDKISASVAIFESDDSIVHVSAPCKFIYQETQVSGIENVPGDILGKTLDGNWLLLYFYNNNLLHGGGSTYSARALVLKSIYIPDDVDMYIDEFLILTVLPFGKSYFIDKPLSVWRIHNANYSGIAVTKEQSENKERRLLKSSKAILTYLQEHFFDKQILKIYRLKHSTKELMLLELMNKRKTADVIKYASGVFFDIKPDWNIVIKYHVLNRFVPIMLFRFLKKFKKK